MASFAKDTTDGGFPYGADQGHPYLCAAAKAGVSLQSFSLVLSAGANVIVFADQGLTDMADANYHVYVGGELTLTEGTPNTIATADLSTRTPQGFTLINGVSSDVAHVMIVGQLEGQAA